MFRPVNFVAKDVCHDEFLHQSGLENVSESIQRGDFLCFPDEADDLMDVVHERHKAYLRRNPLSRLGLGAFTSKPRDFPSRKVYGDRDILPRDPALRDKLIPRLRDESIFFIRHALRAGFTIEETFNLTKIDRWFLVQIKEIVDFKEELAGASASRQLLV